jgi:hypothetical protein
MENWKDINEEEEWASKVRLVTLFLMKWEAPILCWNFLTNLLSRA